MTRVLDLDPGTTVQTSIHPPAAYGFLCGIGAIPLMSQEGALAA
jgi:hypothetical protein